MATSSSDLLTLLKSPPVIITNICIFAVGIWLGNSFSSAKSSTSKATSASKKKSWPNSYDVKVHRGSSDEEDEGREESEEEASDDEEDIGELKDFSDTKEEVKLVLVIRTDLGMTKGKMAAQASHATLAVYKALSAHAPSLPILRRWESHGQPKIALQSKSEDEILILQAQAMSMGLCARTIRDAGRTQIAAGSLTVLGILGPKGIVDGVTGKLKLL